MNTLTTEALEPCPDCGIMVPVSNMELHQVNSCGNNARHSILQRENRHQQRQAKGSYSREDLRRQRGRIEEMRRKGNTQPRDTNRKIPKEMTIEEENDDNDFNGWGTENECVSTTSGIDLAQLSPRRSRSGEGMRHVDLSSADTLNAASSMDGVENTHPLSPGVQCLGEVVNLVDDDDDDMNPDIPMNTVNDGDSETITHHWSCPQCTLLNSLNQARCKACGQGNTNVDNQVNGIIDMTTSSLLTTNGNDTSIANESDLRRRRIPNNGITTRTNISSFTTIDGVVQPTSDNNTSNNRNSLRDHVKTVGSSALLGSIVGAGRAYVQNRSPTSGAINGAFVGAVGGALYSATHDIGTSSRTNRSQRPVSTVNASHTPPTLFAASIYETLLNSANGNNDHLDNRLQRLSSLRMGPQNRDNNAVRYDHGDINSMSYERLLEVFGDGSENRGANQAVINSLPTSTIKDLEKELPINCRTCSICLENFSKGDVRKTLPCLHGFHQGCVDKWLVSNGCCPICKHQISS